MPTPLVRLLPYHERYRVPFWVGMTVLVLARVFEAGIPYFLKIGIDRLTAAPDGGWDPAATRAALLMPTLAIFACVAARYATAVAGRRVVRRIGVAVAYDLRKRVYAHLQRMGPRFFARHPTGDLMARAINDINLIRQLIGGGLRTLGVIVITALVGFVCMFALAPDLALLLLLPLPVIGYVGWRMSRVVFARSQHVQEGFSELSERVQENLNGIRTIQALVQEDAEIERFDRVNLDYARRFLALTGVNSQLAALMPWLGYFVTVIILGYGGALVQRGDMTLGTFAAFFTYVSMVLWPARQAGQLVTQWQQGASACARLYEVLDQAPEIEDRGQLHAPDVVIGDLRIDHLTFHYPDARSPALQNVSLDVGAGQTVAILGRVGAGKTTLLKCLVRLLDPPPASVWLDGVDVRDFPLAGLRARISMVPQDPFLFGASLHHNLSYDAPERSADEVWQAARGADLADTIEDLPARLDTIVGERGVTLSGGQKQRATLTRGLIRDAAVLLLDDCFSSVDTQTEERILRSLKQRRGRHTTILVSHRVSTARHADQIVVLEDGAVLEQGSHEALLARGGWYADLERIQNPDGTGRGPGIRADEVTAGE